MLTINTNLSSLIAQSSMETSTNKLNQAIERMTTGFKINHASDNAANYSISTNMTTKIGSYNIAEDNALMGLDMLMSASNTLELINEHYSRIRDLAEQASNGTYGVDSLSAIQSEINARLAEIERIQNSAEYNGINFLESNETSVVEATMNVPFLQQIDRLSTEEAEAQGYTLVTNESELLTAMNNNESICLMNDIDINMTSTYFVHTYSNATFEGNGYTVTLNSNYNGSNAVTFIYTTENTVFKNLNMNYSGIFGYGFNALCNNAQGNVTVENCAFTGSVKTVYEFYGIISMNRGNLSLIDSYNDINITDANQERKGICCNNTGLLNISNYYYNSDKIGDTTQDGATSDTDLDSILDSAFDSIVKITFSDKITNLQVGINGDTNAQITFSTSFAQEIPEINCLSADGARNSILLIDSIINKINNKQVEIGAIENRLESVLEEITIQRDNLISSRSTIRDADIAEVSSNYIQQQILQQASATLLATANQSPSIALQLI